MPYIKYRDISFSSTRLDIIKKANLLIVDYRNQGYVLTLRQLYYQFVARGWIPNSQMEYKKLGDIINDGRLGGLIDWYAIEDRTRELAGNNHWENPESIIDACASQFMIDKWEGQECRVEVWVEKDALEGVVGKAARECDINYFSCRGYTSQTAMWNAGQRLKKYAQEGYDCVILHLGDHDPSGIDMSRDIEERIRLFMDGFDDVMTFRRVALNDDQIQEYNPPPNPAKVTDSRFNQYQEKYGDESWELDALEPSVIHDLIVRVINEYRNEMLFVDRVMQEENHRRLLSAVASNWAEVIIPQFS